MARAIDVEKAMEVAQIKYNDWNLAMAAADGQREINLCFKKQELFKAVKAVLECVPTLTPPNELMEALEAINNAAVAYIEGGPYENDLPGMELALKIDRLSRDFVRPPEGEEEAI